MNELEAPIHPTQIYSQGYWHAVAAAALYFFQSSILTINLLGYILGHCPQNFALKDDERTLILQTMLMSIWLAVGGAVFHATMDIPFTDALYFSDVTVLTVGYGDFAPNNNLSRGLDIPYAVIGIIILGLVAGSIHWIGRELKYRDVVKSHFERRRALEFERSRTLPPGRKENDGGHPGFQDLQNGHTIFGAKRSSLKSRGKDDLGWRQTNPISAIVRLVRRVVTKHSNALQLRNHEDRFHAMRSIQKETSPFRTANSLVVKSITFAVVWFCVTILVSEMAETVIAGFQLVSVTIGDWSILPKRGAVRFLTRNIHRFLSFLRIKRAKEIPAEQQFSVGLAQEGPRQAPLDHKPRPLPSLSNHELSKHLVSAITKAANDLKRDLGKRYNYDEWRHFTYLIQFTTSPARGFVHDREESTVVDWDWLGESSPMVAGQSEPQWVINRLSESPSRHLDHVHWKVTERQAQSQSHLEASSAQQGSSSGSNEEAR